MSGATPAVERLGVAIQGAGNVAGEHLRAYLGNPHVEVVAISSRTLEGAERKARQVGLDPGRVRLYDGLRGPPGGPPRGRPLHLHAP